MYTLTSHGRVARGEEATTTLRVKGQTTIEAHKLVRRKELWTEVRYRKERFVIYTAHEVTDNPETFAHLSRHGAGN